MESLVQWYAENGSALWATIIGFFSAYGVAIFSLVIGIIRTKLVQIKQAKESDAKLAELIDRIDAKLDAMEREVIEASNVNTEKRIEAMQQIADAVNIQNEALKEAQIIDANSALSNLE